MGLQPPQRSVTFTSTLLPSSASGSDKSAHCLDDVKKICKEGNKLTIGTDHLAADRVVVRVETVPVTVDKRVSRSGEAARGDGQVRILTGSCPRARGRQQR
jgi:hypothetical protein